MSIIIKKATKKTVISILSLLGLSVAVLSKLFFGGGYMNINKLGADNERCHSDIGKNIVDSAWADGPGDGVGDNDGGDDTSGSDCGCDSSSSL